MRFRKQSSQSEQDICNTKPLIRGSDWQYCPPPQEVRHTATTLETSFVGSIPGRLDIPGGRTSGEKRMSTFSSVRRLHRCALVVAALVVLVVVSNYLISLIYYYRGYLLALLPEPPLPVQKRPPTPGIDRVHTIRVSEDVSSHVPRVLCMIATSPRYHSARAAHVASTWARHCTRAVFLTTVQDSRLQDVVLTPGADSYEQLWGKVTKGFEWAYEHRSEFDWVVKADDDTFVVVENLQAAVLTLDPTVPFATGVHLRTWDKGSNYLNGGAGYVLSREAVTLLVEVGLQQSQCDINLELGTNEDVNMAKCLTLLGVKLLDSRDYLGRQRFHVYPPQEMVDPRRETDLKHLWLKEISIFPYKFGYADLSENVISFHYVDAETMYLIYYLIYILNPYSPTNIGFDPAKEVRHQAE